MKIDLLKTYKTRSGLDVKLHEIRPFTSAGNLATFPVKGDIIHVTPKGKVRREFNIWKLNGCFLPAGEKQGITCGVCGCQLSFDEHEQELLIACKAPLRIEGESNPDLIKYLEANARECEDNGYAGFSFIDRR